MWSFRRPAPRRFAVVAAAALLAAGPAAAQEVKIAPEARVGEVWALSVSPDGRQLAAARGFGGVGGAVVVWDLVAGTHRVLAENPRALLGVAFSPDGTKIASGGHDKVLRVHDAATGKLLHQLTGHGGSINAVAWSPDGALIATASLDKTVRLWDLDAGRQVHRFDGHADWVLGVAWAPDSKWLVSGSKDGTVKTWDVAGRKEARTLRGHPAPVQSVAVSPDGKWIASGCWAWHVRLWDAATGEQKELLKLDHRHGIYGLCFSPDSRTLVSTSGSHGAPGSQGEIKRWDIEAGKPLVTLLGHLGGIWCAAFAPDGRTLFTGGADQTIQVWELATERPRRVLATMAKPEPAPPAPAALDFDTLNARLAGPDARKAYAAVMQLARSPKAALPWLCARLTPADPARDKQLRRWAAALGSEDAAVRAEATKKLTMAGPAALAVLRELSEAAPEPELRQHAAELLKKLAPAGGIAETVYLGRLLEALELIGGAEARTQLAALAKGAPDAWLTRQARAGLKRLERRDAAAP